MARLSEIMNKFLDLVFLTIYWLVSCIPVFTIGAATTALYYTTQKVIKNDRGYVSGEYWGSFKQNFKTATACWLIHLLLGLLFADEGYVCYQMWADGQPIGWLWILFLVFEVLNVTMALITFPYIARFDDRARRVMKNALLILLANLPKGILQLLILAVFVIAVIFFPPMMILAPASYMLLSSYVLEKVFRKYMSPEDLEEERIRNAGGGV